MRLPPPLSSEVDLKSYSLKLSLHAKFILYKNDNDSVGYTAFYLNDAVSQIYIPLICVFTEHQHEGIGSRMIELLEDEYKGRYETIVLEVVKENTKAYNFYIKQGFKILEDRGKKFLMVKNT